MKIVGIESYEDIIEYLSTIGELSYDISKECVVVTPDSGCIIIDDCINIVNEIYIDYSNLDTVEIEEKDRYYKVIFGTWEDSRLFKVFKNKDELMGWICDERLRTK